MKYVKFAGIVWATIYFVIGAMKSFVLNSNDTWASVALLLSLFLLPLPITIMAVWFPKGSGRALLGCVAIIVIVVAAVVVNRQAYLVSDIGQFIVFIALYNIPLLLFSWAYLHAGRGSRNTDSSGNT